MLIYVRYCVFLMCRIIYFSFFCLWFFFFEWGSSVGGKIKVGPNNPYGGFRVVADSTGVVGKGEEGMHRGICSFYYIIIWFHVV
jgi:hypothetical protein